MHTEIHSNGGTGLLRVSGRYSQWLEIGEAIRKIWNWEMEMKVKLAQWHSTFLDLSAPLLECDIGAARV